MTKICAIFEHSIFKKLYLKNKNKIQKKAFIKLWAQVSGVLGEILMRFYHQTSEEIEFENSQKSGKKCIFLGAARLYMAWIRELGRKNVFFTSGVIS